MNKRQLSDRIGNIDGQLVEDAQYRRHRKTGNLRRFLAAAAVAALMLASFTVGAMAFSQEVPVEQETIALPKIGLTLILPDSWKGRYGVEMNEDGSACGVYVKMVHEADETIGYLFWVGKAYDEPMTPSELEERSAIPCRYLFATANATYSINYASDVEYDPENPEETQEYLQVWREKEQIRFVLDNALSG
ncbi:MAG: hypothetical protein HFF57_01600 [Lawsonibacter sp.]|jgi:hypothetical protein|nr:hypothetical protein [Lawsonibacter sp.]